jgi:hypothetical protein
MPSDAWIEMNSRIELAGGPKSAISAISGENLRSMEIIYNEGIKCVPWLDIIMESFPLLSRDMELEIVISCLKLKDKEVHRVVPLLIQMFYEDPPPFLLMETAARVLAYINAPSSYSDILKLCGNKGFGPARFDLLILLSKVKSVEATEVLKRFLDPAFAGHLPPGYKWRRAFVKPDEIGVAKAMRALAATKNEEALRTLSNTQVPESLMPEKEGLIVTLKRSLGHGKVTYNPAVATRRRRRKIDK